MEPHAEVAPLVRGVKRIAAVTAVLALIGMLVLAGAPLGPSTSSVPHPSPSSAVTATSVSVVSNASTGYPPLKGNFSGPALLSQNATHAYTLNATGGPAYSSSGTAIGTITYFVSIVGTNTTGVNFLPSSGAVPNGTAQADLTVTSVVQTLSLKIEYTSVYRAENVSINLTYTIHVVQPYVLSGILVVGSQSVLAFSIQLSLDGRPVGSIAIPALAAHAVYNFSYDYVTLPLGAGSHTFVLTLPFPHGQVHFANGQQSYSVPFYVAGAPPNYTYYYVLGVVAFVAVVLISLLYVGSRRPGAPR